MFATQLAYRLVSLPASIIALTDDKEFLRWALGRIPAARIFATADVIIPP
jgi:hypothetical protein